MICDAEIVGVEAERAQPLDQFVLRDDARAAAGQLALDPLVNIDVPAGPPQQKPAQQAAHRAADDDGASPRARHATVRLDLSVHRNYPIYDSQ